MAAHDRSGTAKHSLDDSLMVCRFVTFHGDDYYMVIPDELWLASDRYWIVSVNVVAMLGKCVCHFRDRN